MANFVIVKNKKDLRYVKDHFIFPHKNPFVRIIKHPDLSHAMHTMPIFWELKGNMIVEMEPADKELKLKLLKNPELYKDNMSVMYPWYMRIILLLLIVGVCYLIFNYKKLGL